MTAKQARNAEYCPETDPSVRLFRAFCLLVACLAAAFGFGAAASAQGSPMTPAKALAYEKADQLPPNSFYDTPSPLPPGKPGTLIRSEKATDYSLPKGARAVRILYHSQSAKGNDVAASGVVLLPAGKAPKGGWPVIAWAHGTSGVARICAPSMMKDVYYGDEGLFPMVQAGFAVVATDYAGLGTVGPHQYVDRIAQAHDVIDSIQAAHSAVPDLSRKWAVDGHSQGGGAAWGVAEQEAVLKDPNYLGAVVVAGTINPRWFMTFNSVSPPEEFYTVYAAYGIKARFPEFNVANMLSPKALAYYKPLTSKGCWYYGSAVARAHVLGKVVKPGWTKNKWVQKFVAENRTLQKPVAGPMFVLAGGADHSIPPQSVRVIAMKACKMGYTIDFRIYPGLDHDPLMYKSTPDQLRWIRNRFAGNPAPNNCATITRR